MARTQNRIAVIALYFGKAPSGLELWLKSSSLNQDVDFYLIGDCFGKVTTPSNVFYHYLSFDDLRQMLASKFGARPINSPYKLCDFKPAFGALFPSVIDGYDIWGFTDLDLVYGDLCGTIDFDNLSTKWGRVFDYGHLSFFSNSPRVVGAFKEEVRSVDTWQFVKNSRLIWIYDERYYRGFGGVNGRLECAGYRVERCSELFSDVRPEFRGFFDSKATPSPGLIYLWDEGKLWKICESQGQAKRTELSYAHLQKREVNIQWLGKNTALLTPSHWASIKTLEEGVAALKINAAEDKQLRQAYVTLPMHIKLKKWSQFLLEVVSISGGWAAFALFLRSHTHKR